MHKCVILSLPLKMDRLGSVSSNFWEKQFTAWQAKILVKYYKYVYWHRVVVQNAVGNIRKERLREKSGWMWCSGLTPEWLGQAFRVSASQNFFSKFSLPKYTYCSVGTQHVLHLRETKNLWGQFLFSLVFLLKMADTIFLENDCIKL